MHKASFAFATSILLCATARTAYAATVSLPATGVSVDLPGTWTVQASQSVDTIERTDPPAPFVGIGFALMKGDTDCEKRLVRMSQAAGGDMQPRPNFVPNGYYTKIADVSIKYGAGSVRHEIIACALTSTGALHASVQFDTPLSSDDFASIRMTLDRVAAAVERLSAPAPKPAGGDDDDSSKPSEAPAHTGGPWEISAIMIHPNDAKQTVGYGGAFGMDMTDVIGSDAVGFAYNFSGWIGGDSASRILWDTKFGLGLSFSLPHVQLIPLVSLGIDGGQGAGDGDFNIKPYGYWDLGGRVRLRVSSFAFELGYDRVTRGSFFSAPGPDVEIPHENRFLLKYLFAGSLHAYLGLRFIDYQGAVTAANPANTNAAGWSLLFGFKI